MPQDVTQKQVNFLIRYVGAVAVLLDALDALSALNSEWTACGFATGAPLVENTNFQITDAVVQGQYPALTAAMINSAQGAVTAILNTEAANIGYLETLRP